MQYGSGLNGGGCDIPHLIAASVVQLAETKSLSAALLFIDVRTAFAEVQRASVVTTEDGTEQWALFLVGCGFTREAAMNIVNQACRVAMLVENGMTTHAAQLLNDLHVNTWFSVEALGGIVRTTVGTIAGHPMADLIFALADAEVDAWYQKELESAGLLVTIPTAGVAERWGHDEVQTDNMPLVVAVRRPAYCDDAIVPIIAAASVIIDCLAKAASLGQLAYARFGLSVNFKAGKTEAVVRFRGTGSEVARRTTLVVNKAVVACASMIGDPFELRIVPKYKHLGGWLNCAADFAFETCVRGAIMSKAVHPIRKKFLHNPDVGMPDKLHVVSSLVLSKGLHMAGTWPALNVREHSKITASIGRVFRQIVPIPDGQVHNGHTSVEVQSIVGHMAPLNYIRILRIALFARICKGASPIVLAILHATYDAPRSWLKSVIEDLEFVTACSSKCRSLGSLSFIGWVRHFQVHGKRGVDALRIGFAESSCNNVSNLALPHHTVCEDEYVCNVCGDRWPSVQQLAVHLARRHRRLHDIRRFLPYGPPGEIYGATHCQVCLLEKHTRAGIVEHLADKRNGACAANLMLRVKPVGLRQSRLWDEMAAEEPCRRVHGRIPAYRHMGPALFVVGITQQHHKNGIKHMARG